MVTVDRIIAVTALVVSAGNLWLVLTWLSVN
jgi:hypothetical protein